jgi:CRP-like cAMP-binding protein
MSGSRHSPGPILAWSAANPGPSRTAQFMSQHTAEDAPERPLNRLLAALPPTEYGRLHSRIDVVRPRRDDVLYERGSKMEFVYFPESGTISLLAPVAEGDAVEVGTVGNEGMGGLSVALGGDTSPHRATMQIPGRVLRMRAADFRELVPPGHPLHLLALRYAEAFTMQISQSVACNRVHTVSQRLARWLCITHDRVGSEEFPLTQEVIAQMLGVRRQTVSEVASEFQSARLIDYRLGRVTIENRQKLERAACECYATVRAYFERLLGTPRG